MNRFFNELVDTHVKIENWLGQGKGDLEVLLSRFDRNFSMISINGTKLDFLTLEAFFQNNCGTKDGLKIIMDKMEILAEWSQGALVSYVERQVLPNHIESLRHSTVLLTLEGDEMLWRHLHETPASES